MDVGAIINKIAHDAHRQKTKIKSGTVDEIMESFPGNGDNVNKLLGYVEPHLDGGYSFGYQLAERDQPQEIFLVKTLLRDVPQGLSVTDKRSFSVAISKGSGKCEVPILDFLTKIKLAYDAIEAYHKKDVGVS